MMHSQGKAAEVVKLLDPVSAANTAAATSGWVDVRKYEGDIQIVIQTGAITGTLSWGVEDATDGAGSGGAAFAPDDGQPGAASANTVVKRTIKAKSTRGWIRVVGTIVTGPSLVAAHIAAHPKQTT